MRLAVDLHLHSRYSQGVSPAMTFENIAVWALRKGMDLLGTGDCLQEDWLQEVEAATVAAESGLLMLKPEIERRVWARLPANLRCTLRFVLSTEVNSQPSPKGPFDGIHFLLYFPSIESARGFRRIVQTHGDLSEGRPTLNLNPLQLLECLLDYGENCHFAPAHVFNPWFSALGTVGGESALDELFVDHTSHLFAVETGLTSTPPMCRRVSSLDRFALFSCSDAHSLENLGRECTILDIEPSYDALFSALSTRSAGNFVQTFKFPLHSTRYFLNWCGRCQQCFDAVFCPQCGKSLVAGSRDRLERIADRSFPIIPAEAPPFQELLPLAYVVANLAGRRPESDVVKRICQQLIETVGNELAILTSANEAEIAEITTPQLAHTIVAQRQAPTDYFKSSPAQSSPVTPNQQVLLDLGSIDRSPI